MRLSLRQLPEALSKRIAPLYLLSGDEPLQLGEAADAIRGAARKAGYGSREVFSEDTGIAWHALTECAASLSIFAEKKIIELRIPSAKFGSEGAHALSSYCEHLPDDTLLLIICGKLTAASLKTKWLQTLDKIGVIVQVWPPEGRDLLAWLQHRLQQRGLRVDEAGLKFLAARVEGNLLAAAQEIEKLYILYGARTLSGKELLAAVADSSRYDVFSFGDALLTGKPERMLKILNTLKAEGIAAPVVLWSVTREARQLLALKALMRHSQSPEAAYTQLKIWDKRKPLLTSALQRLNREDLQSVLLLSAAVDRQIKGEQSGDPWETLLSICMLFAGVRVLPAS
ncbi:MAG: DNA polymerase III subunit delta [Gammaproteobacteria bacterium]